MATLRGSSMVRFLMRTLVLSLLLSLAAVAAHAAAPPKPAELLAEAARAVEAPVQRPALEGPPEFAEARALREELVRTHDERARADAVVRLAEAQVRIGDRESAATLAGRAEALLRRLPEHCCEYLGGRVVLARYELGGPAAALAALDRIPSASERRSAAQALFDRCLRDRRLDPARALAARLFGELPSSDAGLWFHQYLQFRGGAALLFHRAGLEAEADRLLREIEAEPLREAATGRRDSAATIAGVAAAALRACGQTDRAEAALQFGFREAERASGEGRFDAFAALACQLAEMGDRQRAAAAFRRLIGEVLLARDQAPDDEHRGWHQERLLTIADALAHYGLLAELLPLLPQLDEEQRFRLLVVVGEELVEAGRPREALVPFRAAAREQFREPREWGAWVEGEIIRGLAAGGARDEALALARLSAARARASGEVEQVAFAGTVLVERLLDSGRLQEGLRVAGDVARAAATIREAEPHLDLPHALLDLVQVLCRAGKLEAARAAARRAPGPRTRSRADEMIAEALARAGRFKDAVSVARGISEGATRARALAAVAEAVAAGGRTRRSALTRSQADH